MKKRLLQLFIFLFLATTSHAYYQAEQGRWLNRDPIGERGGLNVYGFSKNGAVSSIDVVGLSVAFEQEILKSRDIKILSSDVLKTAKSEMEEIKAGKYVYEENKCCYDCPIYALYQASIDLVRKKYKKTDTYLMVDHSNSEQYAVLLQLNMGKPSKTGQDLISRKALCICWRTSVLKRR